MAGNEIKPQPGNDAPHGKPGSVKTFSCPSCGSKVTIRAVGMTITAVCEYCLSIIDTSNENYQVLSQAAKKMKSQPLIHLGSRGKFQGTVWEVIGYVERCDNTGVYFWSEYLLFNPTKGFRWLTEANGHWNWVLTTKEKPVVEPGFLASQKGRKKAKYLGKTYYLFNKGWAQVTYVIGEFYWRASIGEMVEVEDYVSPPEILSMEKNKGEIIWSLGQYVSAESIKESFPLTRHLPQQTGVAPNQPSTVSQTSGNIGRYWKLFLGILFAIQFTSCVMSHDEKVYSDNFVYDSSATDKVKVTKQFELKHGTANLELDLTAQVVNHWLEIQAELVNDKTGQTLEFEQGVEYYAGSDSDGPWSEGDQHNALVLSSIPAGKYHLNIEPASDVNSGTVAYSLAVKRDVTTWGNFFWGLLLITIYPLIIWWRKRSFEVNRWSQSDFSPYVTEDA